MMLDVEPGEEGAAAIVRRLRLLVLADTPVAGSAGDAAGWRDDLRLFALTWLAGFVFFLILFA